MYLLVLNPRVAHEDKCYFVAECKTAWDVRKKYNEWCRSLRKNFPHAPPFEYRAYRLSGNMKGGMKVA